MIFFGNNKHNISTEITVMINVPANVKNLSYTKTISLMLDTDSELVIVARKLGGYVSYVSQTFSLLFVLYDFYLLLLLY